MDDLLNIIEKLFPKKVNGATLSEETDLINDLSFDSINMITLISHIKEKFKIDIFSTGAEKARTNRLVNVPG